MLRICKISINYSIKMKIGHKMTNNSDKIQNFNLHHFKKMYHLLASLNESCSMNHRARINIMLSFTLSIRCPEYYFLSVIQENRLMGILIISYSYKYKWAIFPLRGCVHFPHAPFILIYIFRWSSMRFSSINSLLYPCENYISLEH